MHRDSFNRAPTGSASESTSIAASRAPRWVAVKRRCYSDGDPKRIQCRRGFTLLELLLALALTSLVVVVIGMAIDFHLRTLDSSRTTVEEAMVARAVLRHIAKDLRNAVLYEPIDLSSVQEMVGEADPATLQGAMDSLGGTDGSESGDALGTEVTASGLDELDSLNTQDIAGTVEPTSVPGLFGNQYELQVDVSHLPRVDQYEAALAALAEGATPDIVSDVKTVAYFLRTDESQSVGVGLAGRLEDIGSGLIRREMDRAMTSWASQSGTLDPSAGGGSMLAPEVNYLEFRYFDGLEWQVEWDSEQMGGLPVAVEITVGIDPTGGADPETLDSREAGQLAAVDMSEYLYRLVVHLPVARPTALDDASLESGGMEALGL